MKKISEIMNCGGSDCDYVWVINNNMVKIQWNFHLYPFRSQIEISWKRNAPISEPQK